MAGGTDERLYGRNPVYEVLRAGRRRVRRLLVAEGALERGKLAQLLEMASRAGVRVERVRRSELDRESDSHQGVGAEVEAYPYVALEEIMERAHGLGEPPWVLLLDVVQNPQNLGTLLRTAEAVGVHGVVIPARRGVGVTQAVVSASSGASEHLRVARENLARAMERLKAWQVWIAGLEDSPEAMRLDQARLDGPLGLVVGNEAEGMRRLVRQGCDFLVRLPMRGQVDSLNAAAAGSVALYAVWAQRGYFGERPPQAGAVPGRIDAPDES